VHALAPSAAKLPAEHSVQTVEAEEAEYQPDAHVMHSSSPSALWYSPAAHSVHAVAPEADTVPAEHTVHTVAPVSAENQPDAHAMHSSWRLAV